MPWQSNSLLRRFAPRNDKKNFARYDNTPRCHSEAQRGVGIPWRIFQGIPSIRYRSVGMTEPSVISTKVAQQLRGDIYSLYALLRRYLDYARYDGKRDTLHSLRSVGMTSRRMPSSVGMTEPSVISTKVAQQLRGDIYSLYALLRGYLDYARYDGKRDTLHSLSLGRYDR